MHAQIVPQIHVSQLQGVSHRDCDQDAQGPIVGTGINHRIIVRAEMDFGASAVD